MEQIVNAKTRNAEVAASANFVEEIRAWTRGYVFTGWPFRAKIAPQCAGSTLLLRIPTDKVAPAIVEKVAANMMAAGYVVTSQDGDLQIVDYDSYKVCERLGYISHGTRRAYE